MKIGQKYLITTDNWFFAPDGDNYKAVFGTVHSVEDSASVLGIRTNAKSTNWYVVIGDMVVAGCQIHYAVRAENYNPEPPMHEQMHEGQMYTSLAFASRIYNADLSGMVPSVS